MRSILTSPFFSAATEWHLYERPLYISVRNHPYLRHPNSTFRSITSIAAIREFELKIDEYRARLAAGFDSDKEVADYVEIIRKEVRIYEDQLYGLWHRAAKRKCSTSKLLIDLQNATNVAKSVWDYLPKVAGGGFSVQDKFKFKNEIRQGSLFSFEVQKAYLHLFSSAYISSCEEEIVGILASDDAGKLKWLLAREADISDRFPRAFSLFSLDRFQLSTFQPCASTILGWACLFNARFCVDALIKRCMMNLRVDVDSPVFGGYFPLHLTAKLLYPKLVAVLLLYARSDVICADGIIMEEDRGVYPLNIALQAARNDECLKGWTPGRSSIFKLIILLCLWKMRDALETIRALSRRTKNIEMVVYRYAKEGKLIELAILLIVSSPSILDATICQGRDGSSSERSMTISQCMKMEFASLIDEEFKLVGNIQNR